MVQSHEPARGAFQAELDALTGGGELQLLPREFPGPVTIAHPLTLDGQGATIWSLSGPVVSIRADGVALRNLKIEVTGEVEPSAGAGACALWVEPGCSPLLENVEVRGSVIGLAEEEGAWEFPHALRFGPLAHGVEHDFLLRIIVPVPCRLSSNISGLEVAPRSLKAGRHEVRLHVERISPDTLLSGTLSLSSSFLKRHIAISALILPPRSGQDPHTQGTGQVVWEPNDWSSSTAGLPHPALPPVSSPVEPRGAPPPPPAPAAVPPPQPARRPPADLPAVRVPPRSIDPPAQAPPAPPMGPEEAGPPIAPPPAVPVSKATSGMRPVRGQMLGAAFTQPESAPASWASDQLPTESATTAATGAGSPLVASLFQPPGGGAGLPETSAPSAPPEFERPPSSRPLRTRPASPLFGAPPHPDGGSPPPPQAPPEPMAEPSDPRDPPPPKKGVRPGGISPFFGPTPRDDDRKPS